MCLECNHTRKGFQISFEKNMIDCLTDSMFGPRKKIEEASDRRKIEC